MKLIRLIRRCVRFALWVACWASDPFWGADDLTIGDLWNKSEVTQ